MSSRLLSPSPRSRPSSVLCQARDLGSQTLQILEAGGWRRETVNLRVGGFNPTKDVYKTIPDRIQSYPLSRWDWGGCQEGPVVPFEEVRLDP